MEKDDNVKATYTKKSTNIYTIGHSKTDSGYTLFFFISNWLLQK